MDADAAIDLEEVKELLVTQGQILESAKLMFADQNDLSASNQPEMQELLQNLCGQYFLARKDLDPTGVGRVTRVQPVTGAERYHVPFRVRIHTITLSVHLNDAFWLQTQAGTRIQRAVLLASAR